MTRNTITLIKLGFLILCSVLIIKMLPGIIQFPTEGIKGEGFGLKILETRDSDGFKVKLRPDIYVERNYTGTDPNCLNTINNFVTDDGEIQIPKPEDVKDLNQVQLECLYHRYVNSLQKHCGYITRIGPLKYGGWNLCMDQNYTSKPVAVALMVSDRKDYSLYLKAISEQYQHRIYNVNVNPANQQTSGQDGGTHASIDSAKNSIELPSTDIDILTLDMGSQVVEYLKESIRTSSIKGVKQLSFFLPGIDDFSKEETYMEYLDILRNLYTSGFRIVWTGRILEQVFQRHPKRSKTYIITMVVDTHELQSPNTATYLIPPLDALKSLPRNQLGDIYTRYVTSLQILCKQIVRMGRIPDGGWDICHDKKYRPSKDCLVYSFGIDNDFSFDDDIASYGCEVHSFDPSLNLKEHRHSSKVWFHPVGLSGEKRQIKGYRGGYWQLDSIENIRHELGHDKRRIDVLKMDIESSEWDAIPTLVKSGILQDVVQLSIEFHTPRLRDDDVKYYKFLSEIKSLYDAGFRTFWSFTNTNCRFVASGSGKERTACYELDMVNINAAIS